MNVLLPETPVSGASAGSIIAVCAKSGLSEEQLLVAFLDLARVGGWYFIQNPKRVGLQVTGGA
jgi:hypothetical protein